MKGEVFVPELSTLVLDIETIPDPRTSPHSPPANPGTDQDARQPLKPAMQQVIAIAVAWIAPTGALRRLTALGEPTWNEAALIREMFRIIMEGRPRLVGWNTQGFDLPVLVYRALVHHIAAPEFYQFGEPYQGYRRRFDEHSHIDLMDLLSFYGASPRLKLDEMARVLGIPGKCGLDGSQVWPLYQAGDLHTIRTYCETDVLTTALIYGRYAEHRGWWNTTQFTTFEQSVRAWLDIQTDARWQAFQATWQPSSRVIGHAPWSEDSTQSGSNT